MASLLLDVLLAMYFGFGIGMTLKMITTNRVLYRGFLRGQDPAELTQTQYCLFVVFFCLLWPFRFFGPVNEAFRVENRETGDVLPM